METYRTTSSHATAPAPSPPVGAVRRALRIYRAHWRTFIGVVGLQIVFALVWFVLLIKNQPIGVPAAIALSIVFNAWTRGAICAVTLAAAVGEPYGVLQAYADTFGITLVMLVAAVLLVTVSTLGLALLLVVPGVIFYCHYGMLYAPVIVAEQKAAWPALRRSAELTRGRAVDLVRQWCSLGVPLLAVGIAVVATMLASVSPTAQQLAALAIGAFSFGVPPLFFVWRSVAYLDATGFESSPTAWQRSAGRPSEWLGVAVFICAVLLLQSRVLVSAVSVPGGSMLPTIQVGDRVVVDRFAYSMRLPILGWKILEIAPVQRGQVVVFISPVDHQTMLVSRVAATEGDRVEIRNKQLFINGVQAADSFAHFSDDEVVSGPRDNLGPVVVPRGKLFMLSDNRDRSYDSRFWGLADVDSVIGRPTLVYWSWDKDREEVRCRRIGMRIE